MKINISYLKWWHILILVVVIFTLIYIYNSDKEPYKFVGLDNKGQADEIFKLPKYSNFVAKNINNKYKCEEKCRQTLEEIYGVKFPKVRPAWLRNPESGKNMELDGYNDTVKVGFEYNGEQHYCFPNRWHKYKWEFEKQIDRDKLKDNLCKKNNIFLIKIPYTIPFNSIPTFIKDIVNGKPQIPIPITRN
jgi:hypothetical protein